MPVRRNKFGTALKEHRTLNGTVFDSKGEMLRYYDLELLQRGKVIRNLERQVSYPLVIVNPDTQQHINVGQYTPDFVYEELQPDGTWELIVEDFKGLMTNESKFRIKVFQAIYNKTVKITK